MGRLDFEPKLTPETIAKETIKTCKIDKFPVNLEDVCNKFDIIFQEDKLNKGEEGCSFKKGGIFGVLINNIVENERRKKFHLPTKLAIFS